MSQTESNVSNKQTDLDISVLIATYNRADILRQTLESMARLNLGGISVEFVVIDNNGLDHTKQVIESFNDRLPIHYLFERRPGKNCALNKALREINLGKLVVFTDDDVEPRKDWLKSIIAISERWPAYSIFGGQVYPIWPYRDIPDWTQSRLVQSLGFAVHDYADSDQVYASGQYPFGPNFWVRREIFRDVRHFDESIGPRPKNRIMGSETSFLKKAGENGYRMLYSPQVVVGHRVQPCQLSLSNIAKRAYRCGRQGPHLNGLCRRSLLEKHPIFWLLVRIGSIARASLQYLKGMACLSTLHGIETRIVSLIDFGYSIESIKLAWKNSENN